MEEEKAAAYYEELTRKGEGAARFEEGLGFSSSNLVSNVPRKESAVSSSSSFYSSFVKSSSPSRAAKFEREAQLESIQNKLRRKRDDDKSEKEKFGLPSRHRELRDRSKPRKSRSRSRERNYGDRVKKNSDRSNRNIVSPSRERYSVRTSHDYDYKGSSERNRQDREKGKQKKLGTDYSKLITGYEHMTPAQKVQARMKLQLQETAEKDKSKGTGPGWERFDFSMDAPLDDEEIEAADDDTALVKHIGQSFRFASLEAKREEQIKSAHDEAIFGAPSASNSAHSFAEAEEIIDVKIETKPSLLSDKVLQQRGSWRDRAKRL